MGILAMVDPMIKLEKSTLYDATINGITLKLSSLIIETHNTARMMSEEKFNHLEIQTLRGIADAISSLEKNLRNIKHS
jgi:hypothetical protein